MTQPREQPSSATIATVTPSKASTAGAAVTTKQTRLTTSTTINNPTSAIGIPPRATTAINPATSATIGMRGCAIDTVAERH